MTPVELLDELAAIGVTVRLAEPGQVALSPADRIPEAMKPTIVGAKLELAAIVAGRVKDRTQLIVDAFEQLAVQYAVLPTPRPSATPEDAAELEAMLAETVRYAAEEPFRDALAAFVATTEKHFARHLLDVCQAAGISLAAVQAADGELVLKARPGDGVTAPDGLGRALRVLRGPVLANLPSTAATPRRKAQR